MDETKSTCGLALQVKEISLHKVLVAAINRQLYRPEYLLAPFGTLLSESTCDGKPLPAKSMEELYANLRAFQKQIDMELVDLIAQYADAEEKQFPTKRIKELISRRREYDTYIQEFHLEQYAQFHQNEECSLPYQLTEYNDTIARHVLDTVKVLGKDRLLVIFKGGVAVEQTIDE